MFHGIAIVGPNGSGKTTLGKYLAESLDYKHMDVEDYSFQDAAVPYTNPRSRDEVKKLLLADMQKHKKFVLSAVNGDYGEEINTLYDSVVYIEVPLELRLERVKQRSIEKFGVRALEGGDMYELEQGFYYFVASRTMDRTDNWVKTVKCPVIYVDGTKPISENVELIKEWYTKQRHLCL